jgi:hypothetical protein
VDSGTEILIDVIPTHAPTGNLSGRSLVPEAFAKRSGEIVDSLATIGTAFRERLDRMRAEEPGQWGLSEVTVELNLAVQAESGVVITKASASATFTATLTWRSREKQAGP